MLVEQWPQVARVFGRQRDVAPAVGSEALEDLLVVVPVRARVQLHHQAVVHAHPGHLDQHVAGEAHEVLGRGSDCQGALKDCFRVGERQLSGEGGLGRVIGRRGAHLFEELPALLEGLDVAGVRGNVQARLPAETADLRLPVRVPQVDRQVGPERRPDNAGPAGLADVLMPLERVGGRIRRAEHLDAEPVEQRPRPKLGSGQTGLNRVVDS